MIEESIRLDAIYADGIIGLAPSPQRTGKKLFMDELYSQGLVRDRMFSFKFKDKQSTITFGD